METWTIPGIWECSHALLSQQPLISRTDGFQCVLSWLWQGSAPSLIPGLVRDAFQPRRVKRETSIESTQTCSVQRGTGASLSSPCTPGAHGDVCVCVLPCRSPRSTTWRAKSARNGNGASCATPESGNRPRRSSRRVSACPAQAEKPQLATILISDGPSGWCLSPPTLCSHLYPAQALH